MWPRFINAALGIWLMAAPWLLAYGDPAQTNSRIVGPLIATFALVAVAQATRPCRWVCFAAGLWLLAAPWLLGYDETAPIINDMAVGAVVAALALIRGKVDKRFGGGWSALFRDEPLHVREARSADAPTP